jgi:hypothetical protein
MNFISSTNATKSTNSGPGFLDTIKNAIGLGSNNATKKNNTSTNTSYTPPAPSVGGRRRKSRKARKSRKSRKVKKSRKGSRRY